MKPFFTFAAVPFVVRKAWYAAHGWELVREHFRASPGFAGLGLKDVYIAEYLRRPRYWREWMLGLR